MAMPTTTPTKAAAPMTEIGYAQAINYNWWLYQDETTPELIWPQSISVYDSMRRTDSQVTSVIRAMTLPVRSTPWRIDPNGASDEVVEFVADNLGLPVVGRPAPLYTPRQKDRFSWPEHLRQALLMLPFGHMYFEQVYRVDEAGNRARLRKLAPRMPKTIERIEVAPDGGLISIQQYWTKTDSEPRPIPVDRLVAYVHEREGGNWLGQSILRPAYKNWLLKDRLLRVQAQTIERNGMGIPLYHGQENASQADMALGLDMAKKWRAGEAAGSAVPFGADLALVGVSGTLPDAEPAVRYHDEQIGRAVLAHFLNLGTQTGSWALGTTFADFFTLSLQTLAMQIADTATCHIIEDLVDINFGPNEVAPKLVFDEIGSRQAVTADALVALFGANILTADDRLEESLRQQYGLPPRDPDSARTPPGAVPAGDPAAEDVPMGAQSVAASAGLSDADMDDDSDALFAALAAFTGEVIAARDLPDDPNFNAKHPRGPGGRFRSTFEKVTHALGEWSKGDGSDDPLPEKAFTREQLRGVAVKRGITLKRGASRDAIHDALLDDLRAKTRTDRDHPAAKPSAKFTLKGGGKVDPKAVREVEVENRIREAYRDVVPESSRWVSLADVRDRLSDLPRSEVDEAFRRLGRGDYDGPGGPDVSPRPDRINLTPRDRAAVVDLGGEPQHLIGFEDPSPRPLPKAEPSKLRDKDVAVYQEADGKVSLYEESDGGKRGARVASVPDLAGLEKWADDNGESELGDWAHKEGGVPAAKKAAPAKVAKTAPRKIADGTGTPAKLTRDDMAEGIQGTRTQTRREQVLALAEPRIAKRWNVTREQLDAILAADSSKDRDYWAGLSLDEAKAAFVGASKLEWDGAAGGPVGVIAMDSVARRLGLDVSLSETEQAYLQYAADNPLVASGLASLGEAMYSTTQDWFAGRGITSVELHRKTLNPGIEGNNLYTSWSTLDSSYLQGTSEHADVRTDVPVDRIFSIPSTGFGSIDEGEIVVMPSRPGAGTPAAPAKAVKKATPVKKAARPPLDVDATLTDLRDMGSREDVRDALDLHTIPDVKALMPAGMSKTGKKRDLVDRLAEHLKPETGVADTHALLVAQPGQAGLTPAQKSAVQRYVNSDLVTAQVNGILREGKPPTALIHRLDEAMAASRTTEPMLVFRGISEAAGFGREGGTQKALGLTGSSLPDSLVGHEWTEKSFASTSTRRGIAEVFSSSDNAVLLEIQVPKGTHAIARPGGEEEILLDRGLTYRVTGERIQTTMVGISGDEPSYKRILEVEVVPAKKAAPDLTGANGLSSNPAVRAVQIDNRVRQAYQAVLARQDGGSEWVGLADLRDELGESTNRHEVDAALKRLDVSRDPGGANVIPESNQKMLRPEDREASVRIGDQDKHVISFEDASPRPLPEAAPAKKATAPKAPATPDPVLTKSGTSRTPAKKATAPKATPKDATAEGLQPGYELRALPALHAPGKFNVKAVYPDGTEAHVVQDLSPARARRELERLQTAGPDAINAEYVKNSRASRERNRQLMEAAVLKERRASRRRQLQGGGPVRLREQLAAQGLDTSGTMAQLMNRLLDAEGLGQ